MTAPMIGKIGSGLGELVQCIDGSYVAWTQADLDEQKAEDEWYAGGGTSSALLPGDEFSPPCRRKARERAAHLAKPGGSPFGTLLPGDSGKNQVWTSGGNAGSLYDAGLAALAWLARFGKSVGIGETGGVVAGAVGAGYLVGYVFRKKPAAKLSGCSCQRRRGRK